MRKLLFLLLLASLTGCGAGKNQTNVELIKDMMDQVSLKAQDWDPNRGGEASDRVPPEYTIAQGTPPYPYKNNPIEAEQKLQNPLAGNFDPDTITRGKDRYDIYCGVCHGATGKGDGPVAAKMALKPPSLVSDKVKNFKDGRIFHIITEGQGVMGNYSRQVVDPKDRWKIVQYIRTLQKAN